MARPFWSGTISFGLVNIPVKLYTAVRSRDIHFHLLHRKDNVRLRQQLTCPADNEQVSRTDAVKGYDLGADQMVVIKPQELEALAPKAARTIDLLRFVDLRQIDSLFFDHPYYLLPGEHAGKAYRLLLDAMKRSGKVGIGTFVMRNKQYLTALRPINGMICLETMFYADEIVKPQELGPLPTNVDVSDRELKVAEQLISALSGPFKPEQFRDEYREKVLKLIERKAQGEQIVTQPHVETKRQDLTSLLSALEESLKEVGHNGHGRSHGNGHHDETKSPDDGKTPARGRKAASTAARRRRSPPRRR